jgi:DNA-binding MarR family transcriptional regulator
MTAAGRPAADQRALRDLATTLERTMRWVRRAVRPSELNAAALSTLDSLARSGPMRITDLVARERISQPGMTGLVGRLEAAGLVERGPDESDGRATLVTLTDAGREFLRTFHSERAAAVAEHLRELPAEQQRALLAAADALEALASRPIHFDGTDR